MEQATASTARRRGHQHHPRHATRRRLDASSRGPAQCGPAGSAPNFPTDLTPDEEQRSSVAILGSPKSDKRLSVDSTLFLDESTRTSPIVIGSDTTVGKRPIENLARTDIGACPQRSSDTCKSVQQQRPARCGLPEDLIGGKDPKLGTDESDDDKVTISSQLIDGVHKSSPRKSLRELINSSRSSESEHAVARARGDGNSDDETCNVEEDSELAELAKMRCPSERTEVQAEKEARRRKRCADYPGLAFGSSIFSSDTMMKFSLIRNELQNIMGNQLKRFSRFLILFPAPNLIAYEIPER